MTEQTKTSKAYKLVISGVLVQQTSFSTGGSFYSGQPGENQKIDMLLARDGQNRFTLRGSGLAGAFIATARTLVEALPAVISEGSPSQQSGGDHRLNESVWIFHNAHSEGDAENQIEIRDNVAISQKTGAAKDGAKFNSETLPAGTRWPFLMEVDEYRDHSGEASSIAALVLKQWQSGCLLGRDVARGQGWMKLEDLKLYRLDPSAVRYWPDASKSRADAIKEIEKQTDENQALIISLDQLITTKPQKKVFQCSGEIVISVGQPAADDYGVDFLSVGGNQSNEEGYPVTEHLKSRDLLTKRADRVISPLGLSLSNYLEANNTEPDFNIALTQRPGQKPEPFIPGSSLRGSFRHVLSWFYNRSKTLHNDDAITTAEHERVTRLFGSTTKSGALLISDALPENENWKLALQEMNALDEFTQGAYGGAKFDRTLVNQGKFKAAFEITASDQDELNDMIEDMNNLKKLGEQQFIGLGGGQWKGLGWVKIEINGLPEYAEKEEHHD